MPAGKVLLAGLKLLVGLAIVTGGIYLWMQWTGRQWLGHERFTVITLRPEVEIETYDPDTGWGRKLKMPTDMEISTVAGRGRWRLAVMGELADKFGTRWAVDSICDYLGIECLGISGELKLWDKLRWEWVKMMGDWETVDVDKMAVLRDFNAPDGTVMRDLALTWGNQAENWFESAAVAKEEIGLTLVNTSDVAGMGAHAARPITAMGILVKRISTERIDLEKCVVESSKADAESLSVRWVIRSFDCDWLENSDLESEMILKLGSWYQNWWLGKED